MKKTTYIIFCILGLALSATSCLKSYVAEFDQSSAERMEQFLSEIKDMLISEQYGWRMEYYVGNEDSDKGGINVALKFGEKVGDEVKDTVRVIWEEDPSVVSTSRYVLRSDSGPVLSFDTFNTILHKYGTPSSSYYEGQGGDYEFFITGYDKQTKSISLKGKRNGKTCKMYPLSEPIQEFIDRIHDHSQNFYISTFEGFLGDKKVTGEIDVTAHKFTAYEMEVYGHDEKTGEPLYDIAATRESSYILTDTGIQFYEPLEVFNEKLEYMNFNFDLAKSDTTLTVPEKNIKWKANIPIDWLPYSFYIGDYILSYENGSINISLVQEEDRKTLRVKGISSSFDLICKYDIKTGRIGLRYQSVLKPGTNDSIIDEDHLIVVLLPWALSDGSGGLWMNSNCGMDAVLKLSTNLVTGEVDIEKSLEKPTFVWTDAGLTRTFITTSFLLYYYDTDDTAESPYYGQADKYSFTRGNNQLAYLKQLVKK
jgi:hypothetical protein